MLTFIDYNTAKLNHRGKLIFVVQWCIQEVVRLGLASGFLPIFATLSFHENITSKAEAERRWANLRARLRRQCPDLRGVGVWQRQERGAWHLHMVFDREISVDWLRLSAVSCGFGPQMKLRWIQGARPGFRDMGGAVRTARYITRYITRDERGEEDKGVRVVCFVKPKESRSANTHFGWASGMSQVYRIGRGEYLNIFGELPRRENYDLVCRLGWELIEPERQEILYNASSGVRRWLDPSRYPPDPF